MAGYPIRQPEIRMAHLLLLAAKLVFVLGALTFFLSQIVSTYAFVTYIQKDTIADLTDGSFFKTGLSSLDGIDAVNLLPIGLNGRWYTETEATLVPALYDLGAVAQDGRIYAFGGFDLAGATAENQYRTEVYSTTIRPNGTLSPWRQIGVLPRGLSGHRVVIARTTSVTSTAYVLGGQYYDTDPHVQSHEHSSSAVYQVVITNATGAMDSDHVRMSSLPEQGHDEPYGLTFPSVVLIGNRVYLIGGLHRMANGNGDFQDDTSSGVFYAPILADGRLGAWVQTASLPAGIHSGAAVAYTGFHTSTLYLMGGETSTTLDDSSPPHADGPVRRRRPQFRRRQRVAGIGRRQPARADEEPRGHRGQQRRAVRHRRPRRERDGVHFGEREERAGRRSGSGSYLPMVYGI